MARTAFVALVNRLTRHCSPFHRAVEIIALGCRNLAPYKFIPIYRPFVEFDHGDRGHARTLSATKQSKFPSGSDPNFLEVTQRNAPLPTVLAVYDQCLHVMCVTLARSLSLSQRIVVPIELPKNALYAPSLNVRVKDVRFGGFMKPVIGTTSIPLATKIPW